MKRHLIFILLVPLVGVAKSESPKITVIAPVVVHHVPSVQRVTQALHHAATDLNIGNRPIPNVVLICADRQTADVMMLAPDVDLSIDTLMEADRPVYRVTMVGDTSNRAVAVAMVWFLNTHFRLGWTTPRLMKLAAHIRDDLDVTVTANELADGK